ncbi:hypothetical protein GMORB2_4541 [Geosmithia morbida]|uniref:Uncharacterized protein n=1 Tax=Geosmithia morbida TaxID=1094350 RepID=A0A9P4YPW5_9HYPO|nr:uncharacterized protein GMORB2_4541 [Geosmithia morbida]KAF4119632.1 hypothetical protein GMORB2_4541 [Geosmithia morbida]
MLSLSSPGQNEECMSSGEQYTDQEQTGRRQPCCSITWPDGSVGTGERTPPTDTVSETGTPASSSVEVPAPDDPLAHPWPESPRSSTPAAAPCPPTSGETQPRRRRTWNIKTEPDGVPLEMPTEEDFARPGGQSLDRRLFNRARHKTINLFLIRESPEPVTAPPPKVPDRLDWYRYPAKRPRWWEPSSEQAGESNEERHVKRRREAVDLSKLPVELRMLIFRELLASSTGPILPPRPAEEAVPAQRADALPNLHVALLPPSTSTPSRRGDQSDADNDYAQGGGRNTIPATATRQRPSTGGEPNIVRERNTSRVEEYAPLIRHAIVDADFIRVDDCSMQTMADVITSFIPRTTPLKEVDALLVDPQRRGRTSDANRRIGPELYTLDEDEDQEDGQVQNNTFGCTFETFFGKDQCPVLDVVRHLLSQFLFIQITPQQIGGHDGTTEIPVINPTLDEPWHLDLRPWRLCVRRDGRQELRHGGGEEHNAFWRDDKIMAKGRIVRAVVCREEFRRLQDEVQKCCRRYVDALNRT